MINAALIFAYILIGLCAAAAIILPLIQAFGNPRSLVKIGVSVGGLAVVFFICYMLAGNSTYGNDEVSSSASQRVGAGILTFYVLLFGAVLSIIYTEVSKIIK